MSSVYYAPTALYHIFEDIKAQDPDNFGGQKLLLGGILGDARHFAEGGYHVPRQYLELNLPGDYSIQLPVDEVGDAYAASAIDLTPGSQDGQHLLTRRADDHWPPQAAAGSPLAAAARLLRAAVRAAGLARRRDPP
jgi:hypothetical protein